MAQLSVWHVKFHVENAGGRTVSGPHNMFVGISGTRGDQQGPSTIALIKTVVANGFLGNLQAQGFGGAAAPSGTVVIDDHVHASVPDIWT